MRRAPLLLLLLLGGNAIASAQEPPPRAPQSPPAPVTAPATEDTSETETSLDVSGLFDLGRALFDNYASDDIKAEFRYPTTEEFTRFFADLRQTLQTGSLEEVAAYKPQAEAALLALRAFPDYAPYADWLGDRLDYIDAAETIVHQSPPPHRGNVPTPPATPPRDSLHRLRPTEPVPHYDLWLDRLRHRPVPVAASRYVPDLQPTFARAQIPTELVWLAEVESAFNPEARSPVGARGLYQFMPGTATDLGLSLDPLDERTDPAKSADAAARYLKKLHARFGSWPLALAAYNAGPGRVGRLLEKHEATTYAQIADALPAETRMYVPKVLATLTLRTGEPL